MKRLLNFLVLITVVLVTQSCSDVAFRSQKGGSGTGKGCEGSNCPTGTYAWHQGGFGICSKPCGGGTATQVVECRRVADQVVVADSFCPTPKPASTQTCNVAACTSTYAWNIGPYGQCDKLCGGGTKTRSVLCQDQQGTTVADNLCPQPKPVTSDTCNPQTCPNPPTYSWSVMHGTCSVSCGGGTEIATVVCKSSDGSTVADSNCTTTKPPTSHACNTTTCPTNPTYAWEPGQYGACSKECGGGVQTRSVACKRNDGVYVAESFCNPATKPATQQPCNTQTCPTTGRAVTQQAYVTPAINAVDVILIIDDSGSMKEDQTKLAQRMSGLVADLDALNIDYQVCLTTTDISYYKGSPIKWQGPNTYILNKATANKNTVFINTINALGAEWSSDEQGIKAQYLMIKDFRSSGCLRPQATLSTILVSDEDERSVGGNQALSSAQYQPLTNENYPDTLINYVKSTFNTATYTKPFIWNSIIVKPGDTTCEAQQDAQSSPSFQGTKYAELSNKTNGHIGSICDSDYSNNLKIIKDRTVNSMPGLKLECVPIDNPVVTFDKPINTTISRTGDQLKFTPNVPEGVKITVKYTCPN